MLSKEQIKEEINKLDKDIQDLNDIPDSGDWSKEIGEMQQVTSGALNLDTIDLEQLEKLCEDAHELGTVVDVYSDMYREYWVYSDMFSEPMERLYELLRCYWILRSREEGKKSRSTRRPRLKYYRGE